MSGHLIEPIRDNEDFKEAARNVKNRTKESKLPQKRVIFKGDGCLGAPFSRIW